MKTSDKTPRERVLISGVMPEELREWRNRARSEGQTLSAWIRLMVKNHLKTKD